MKILKVIVLFILVVIVLVLVIALFVKKEYSIEREITINKPAQNVYDYVKFEKNQDYYNKWVMQEKRSTFRGTDGTVGFVYAWDSDGKAGKGEQEIINLVEGKQVDCEVRFEKPFKSVAYLYMTTEAAGESKTNVKWVMKSKMNYPINFMSLFIKGMLAKDMGESLSNLKNNLEK